MRFIIVRKVHILTDLCQVAGDIAFFDEITKAVSVAEANLNNIVISQSWLSFSSLLNAY